MFTFVHFQESNDLYQNLNQTLINSIHYKINRKNIKILKITVESINKYNKTLNY